MKPASESFLFALRASFDALAPQRETLAALVPVLVGDREQGLFAPKTVCSRRRVQEVFSAAVSGANDAPAGRGSESLGCLLYLAHLVILLFWLLDRTAEQRATKGLVAMVARALPLAAAALRLPQASRLITDVDALVRQGLFSEGVGDAD